ncbi:MAG: spore germination protein, partial [Clostridia bacterium]|nr:spore germination protein [Clostridia bacterium]
MEKELFAESYEKNIERIDRELNIGESFDIIKKTVATADGELTLYYIDGMIKDETLLRIVQHFYTVRSRKCDAEKFLVRHVPYAEADVCREVNTEVSAVLSGATLMLSEGF